MPDKCDMEQGPCACGAWHDKAAPRVACMPACEPDPCDPALCVVRPVKTLLKAAKDLRDAQRDYMRMRSFPEKDPLRVLAGELVGAAALDLDRAIAATERRQAPVEPSLGEQREMGVHPSGGEIIP